MGFWLLVVGLPVVLVGCAVLTTWIAWWRVLLIASTVLVAGGVWAWYSNRTDHRFNSIKWKKEAQKPCLHRHKRKSMVVDLLEHHGPEINSPGEAVAVLGAPDERRQTEGDSVSLRWGLGKGGLDDSTRFPACYSLSLTWEGETYLGESLGF